jgi:hypothetical protein
MNQDWLAAANFERAHEILSAVNVLSIDAKLRLAGVASNRLPAEIERARDRLLEFLRRFDLLVSEAESHPGRTLTGTDPRLGGLAVQYVTARRSGRDHSAFFAMSPGQVGELLASNRPEDLSALVECLRDIRALMERHIRADVSGIVGDLL